MKKERKKITYCTTPDLFRSIHMYARSLIELQKGCQIVLCVGINRLLAPPIFLTQGFSFFFFFLIFNTIRSQLWISRWSLLSSLKLYRFQSVTILLISHKSRRFMIVNKKIKKKHAVRLHISLKTSPTKHRSTQSTSVLRFSHWNWYHVRYTHCL